MSRMKPPQWEPPVWLAIIALPIALPVVLVAIAYWEAKRLVGGTRH